MDVIGHQMAFFDLAFAPPRQFMEHVAQTLLDHAENRFLAVFRDENNMIFALPCGIGSGDAAASLGSPYGNCEPPGRPFSSLQQPLL